MDAKQRKFLNWMVKECKSHEDWLAVVSFGLPTLLNDQDLLTELIFNEAASLAANEASGHGTTAVKAASHILGELNLKFTVG